MAGYQTVLVGTDGSDSSYIAVDRAARIAKDGGAKLVILCAYYPLSGHDAEKAQDALGGDAYQVVGANPAEDTLRTAADRAREQGATDVEQAAIEGEPVKTLIDAAAKYSADLVVVGNRGLNTLAGRLLGSVPSDVSRRAPADVLIVHTTR